MNTRPPLPADAPALPAARSCVRPRLGLGLIAFVLTLLAGAWSAIPADAYILAGHRWPGRTITYHDGGPNKEAVRVAVRAWNSSGVRIRFRPASRRTAQVIIRPYGREGCVGILGRAQLGYQRGRRAQVRLRYCRDRYTAAVAATHELGHILGLHHEGRRCAIMNASPPGGCTAPKPFFTRCRLLERDDVQGAVRRYGGRVRPITGNPFCALFAAPYAPAQLTIAGTAPDPAGGSSITARFRAERNRRLVTTDYPAPGLTVAAYRYAGACPAGPPTGTPLTEQVVAAGQVNDMAIDDRSTLAPGRYCYALWTTDQAGRRSATPATATVDVSRLGPQAAFGAPTSGFVGDTISFDDISEPGEARRLSWRWDFGDPGSAENVSTEQHPTHVYAQPGTYTVTLTVTNEVGQASTTTRSLRVDP